MEVCGSGTPIETVSCRIAGSIGEDGSNELLDVVCCLSACISMPMAVPGNGAMLSDKNHVPC